MAEVQKQTVIQQLKVWNEAQEHIVKEQYTGLKTGMKLDEKRMLDNAGRLESEAEKVAGYTISDKMKKIWKVELQILDEVDRICKKYKLRYFMVHGTLLGAVRHKGFIPWDDDVDVAFLRPDYDRFLEIAAGELKEPLSIHTPQTETDIFWGGCARIRNSQTSAIETREIGHEGNQGIWIDVLPLDICTEDEKKLEKKCAKIKYCHMLLSAKTYGGEFKAYMGYSRIVWTAIRLLAACYSRRRVCEKLDRAMRLYTEEPSDFLQFFTGYGKSPQLLRADFADVVELDFEHRSLPAPVGYENYLFTTLGGDYMKFPPEEQRKPKHRGIYDPERPYTYYKEMLFDLFKDVKHKEIILFGAGLMFEDYMKKYGDKYRPSFLVDNDKNKWERSRMGIPIKAPAELTKIPEHKRCIIICSFYYKEIEKQLEEMGIHDYRVYVQRVEWILEAEEQDKGR